MIKPIEKNERLQDEIDRKGLKQNWIAERTGIDTATFSKILNGIHNVTPDQALAIANVIGVNVNDIF